MVAGYNQIETMNKTLIILRGISGAGKSTFANLISEPKVICTADDWFMKDGEYKFDATKLGHAHRACQVKFEKALDDPEVDNIVISNTNAKSSDYNFYVDKAKERGIRVVFVVLEKRHDSENIHNVPSEALVRQSENLKKDIKLI